MHAELVESFNKMAAILEKDQRCKGGWHFGSVGRGAQDEFSDYDPVFLIADKDFEDFGNDVPNIVQASCDELLIFWPENFNSQYLKNFGCLIRINETLHQLDFFMLNADHTDNWWCKLHLKGCTRDNIIFDRTGEVGCLLDKGLQPEAAVPNIPRMIDTYWFHVEMLIKYFRRGDLFKVIKNVEVLFHTHVELLLAEYDTIDWGGWATKVNKCVPMKQQEHLLKYFTVPDLQSYDIALRQCMVNFHDDAGMICQSQQIVYPKNVANQVMGFFQQQLANISYSWE